MNKTLQHNNYVISARSLKKIIEDLRPTLVSKLDLNDMRVSSEVVRGTVVNPQDSYWLDGVFCLGVNILDKHYRKSSDEPIEVSAGICYSRESTSTSYEHVVTGTGRSRLEAFNKMLSDFE